MSTYIIHEGGSREIIGEETDARGYPEVRRVWDTSRTYETYHEPRVGETYIFEENGKWYEREVISVEFVRMVYEDTEELNVRTDTREIRPPKKYSKQKRKKK